MLACVCDSCGKLIKLSEKIAVTFECEETYMGRKCYDLCPDCAARISNLIAIENPEKTDNWISTDDEMPEEKDEPYEVITIIKGAKESSVLYTDGSVFFSLSDDGEICEDYSVTYWQPLPAAPEVLK